MENLWNPVCCFMVKQMRTFVACDRNSERKNPIIIPSLGFLLSIRSAERKGWRRTCHAGWTFFIGALCRTDAGDRCLRYKSERDHQRFSLNDSVRHVRSATEASGSWREINSPWSNYTMMVIFCNHSPFQWEDFFSILWDDSWITVHITCLRLTLVSSPPMQLLGAWLAPEGVQVCKTWVICKSMQMIPKGILLQSCLETSLEIFYYPKQLSVLKCVQSLYSCLKSHNLYPHVCSFSTGILNGGSLHSIITKQHLTKCYQTEFLLSEKLNI